MKISADKFVSVSYTLTVNGEVIEQVEATKPLSFVFGKGGMLPGFEKNIENLVEGDGFDFALTPDLAFGEYEEEMVVTLPKSVFSVNGEVNEDILFEGNQLPMTDSDGNRLIGTIEEIVEDGVVMNFNHPMAGNTLEFAGKVVGVREATELELNPPAHTCGGCGCGSGSCDDGECGCDEGCCN